MKIVMLLFPRVTALDLIGPHEVLARVPGVEVIHAGFEVGPITTDSGIRLQIDHAFDDIDHADVLVIPGGSGLAPIYSNPAAVASFKRLAAKARWITSVCTGALLLGAAGLLDEKPATTHWYAYDKLAAFGAKPTARRVVETGNIITAAGVSAGIDMALTLAARLAGKDIACAIQLGLEYDPEPPFDTGSPAKAPAHVKAMVERIMYRDDPALTT